MTWIRIRPLEESEELRQAYERGLLGYPREYGPEAQAEMRVPDAVKSESIVRAHSLIPRALEHFFAAYGALLDPALPLGRRQHEMIAATVSSLNRCFY